MADDEPTRIRDIISLAVFIILLVIAAWYILGVNHGCEYCV
jgi:hypothetical protein